jgi:predicted amidohydrolase YtcJ
MRAFLVALLGLALCCSAAWAGPEADRVLRNGAVYTVDPLHPWATAVAIGGGRILAVGGDADVKPFVGPGTAVTDLKGHMVLPGFVDSHIHLVEGGIELNSCYLGDCTTAAQVRDTVRRYAAAHPSLKWVVGSGWDVALFAHGNPQARDLDALVPDRPAWLESSDGHSAWVNSRALAIARITRGTADPPNGRIERDRRGNPSGTLRESAVDLVGDLLPPITPAQGLAAFLRAQAIAHRFGITSIQDAHASPDFLAAYREADRKGLLELRVVAALHTDPTRGAEQVDAMMAERAKPSSPLLRVTAAKIFLDGVVETRTAAMLAPYSDGKGGRGFLNMSPDRLQALVTRLDREGFQVHIHAIGDRAVRAALDAFEVARAVNGVRDSRHQIAHLQVVDRADIPRFEALGVTANFQSFWMQEDADEATLDRAALGPKRYEEQYPIAAVAASGAMIVGGSDWSVTTMNPLDAIEVAVTHRALGDTRSPVYCPSQRIPLALALAAYTHNGAWVNFEEDATGRIEVGKLADLIVLDRNLFKIPPSEIHKARVLLTMLGGKPVFEQAPSRADAKSPGNGDFPAGPGAPLGR